MDFIQEFEAAMLKNGISSVSLEMCEQFLRFTEHLVETNRTTNLTAIRDVPSIISKHYIDSILLAAYVPQGARVLDLGCGPGFPSVPLAIVRPDLEIVALDSTAKKIDFVRGAIDLLGLKNLTAVTGRAEDKAVARALGEFDVITSRAVAGLSVLCELSIPYLKVGGVMLAMKGARIEEEVKELLSGKAIKELGTAQPEIFTWDLVCGDETEMRGVVKIKKSKATPAIYPRAYAQIMKKPL